MSLTKKGSIKLSLSKWELLTLIKIVDLFGWQNEEVFKLGGIDTDKKDADLWKLQSRMEAIFNENYNESYIIQQMMEGNTEFPHAQ